jgi:hypothetical protein
MFRNKQRRNFRRRKRASNIRGDKTHSSNPNPKAYLKKSYKTSQEKKDRI